MKPSQEKIKSVSKKISIVLKLGFIVSNIICHYGITDSFLQDIRNEQDSITSYVYFCNAPLFFWLLMFRGIVLKLGFIVSNIIVILSLIAIGILVLSGEDTKSSFLAAFNVTNVSSDSFCKSQP